MIKLLPNWEAELIKQSKEGKNKRQWNTDDRLRVSAMRRSVNARIKEIHRLISTGEAEIVDSLPSESTI